MRSKVRALMNAHDWDYSPLEKPDMVPSGL